MIPEFEIWSPMGCKLSESKARETQTSPTTPTGITRVIYPKPQRPLSNFMMPTHKVHLKKLGINPQGQAATV